MILWKKALSDFFLRRQSVVLLSRCSIDHGHDRNAHINAAGCYAGYSVNNVQIQTGTETIQITTQKIASGSNQELTGYACGCGTTK